MEALEAPSHLYVVGRLRHLENEQVGARTWWCIETNAKPGSLGLMYVKGQGVQVLFRVIGRAQTQQMLCAEHRLVTGDVEILAKLEKPLSAQDLREHDVLRRLPALARSFQRRSFKLEEPFLGALLKCFQWSPKAEKKESPARARQAAKQAAKS